MVLNKINQNPATHIVEAYGPAGQPDLDVLTVGSEANSKLNKLGKLVLESMKEAARSVVQVFTQMFDQILLTGQLSFEKLAQSIASVFTSVIAGALGAMLQAKIEEFWKKLEAGDLFPKGKGPKKGGIDTTGWKTLPGVMGAVAGASVGYTSANPLMGGVSGAMAGSAAGPLGMVVGGVAGMIGGILGIGKAAEEEARRLREAKDKWLDKVTPDCCNECCKCGGMVRRSLIHSIPMSWCWTNLGVSSS